MIQSQCGNCFEFAEVVMELFTKLNAGVRAEVVSSDTADHVFVVIDRAQANIADLSSWGEFAVVCDAWAGAVYPAGELPFRLNGFCYFYGQDLKQMNVLTSFNPRYDNLVVEHSVNASKDVPHQSAEFKKVVLKKRTLSSTFKLPASKLARPGRKITTPHYQKG